VGIECNFAPLLTRSGLQSAVKCLVAAGPYVASGGADDLIHLYDMKVGKGQSATWLLWQLITFGGRRYRAGAGAGSGMRT
jgi:hypothetical protein